MSIERYLFELQEPQQSIARILRNMLLNSAPGVMESYKYRCPFFTYKKGLCYLAKNKKEQIYIGFIQGQELTNNQGMLNSYQLKQVAHLVVPSLQFVQDKEVEIHQIIQEAILLNT